MSVTNVILLMKISRDKEFKYINYQPDYQESLLGNQLNLPHPYHFFHSNQTVDKNLSHCKSCMGRPVIKLSFSHPFSSSMPNSLH